MKWGADMLNPKPIPLSRYRRRRRPPFTDITRMVSIVGIWLCLIVLMAFGARDLLIVAAAFMGVAMGAALAVWVRTKPIGRG